MLRSGRSAKAVERLAIWCRRTISATSDKTSGPMKITSWTAAAIAVPGRRPSWLEPDCEETPRYGSGEQKHLEAKKALRGSLQLL